MSRKNMETATRAEETVIAYLKNHGKKAFKPEKGVGDLRCGDTVIEVKARLKSWEEEKPPYITLSSERLTNFYKNTPDDFEVYFVRNLGQQIVRVKGTTLNEWVKKQRALHNEKEKHLLQIKLGKEFWQNKEHYEFLE